ncbi:hypothetical protein MKP05_04550 [Halomonas sp. EGI 63088]|uniref:Uncharacterized protein n=1 Tax=Halomonas flagellata TaxID=2920385 RepID=A0ABS9RRE4_9GAMM|nr:hypothetical protein [Halomonas flagellata]MCH4562404.1 hypothetical protein [Halomonas flagellata]
MNPITAEGIQVHMQWLATDDLCHQAGLKESNFDSSPNEIKPRHRERLAHGEI